MEPIAAFAPARRKETISTEIFASNQIYKAPEQDVRFSNRASLSTSVVPSFVVITAWVTLLYVVGPAMVCRLPQALVGLGWSASEQQRLVVDATSTIIASHLEGSILRKIVAILILSLSITGLATTNGVSGGTYDDDSDYPDWSKCAFDRNSDYC